MLRLRQRCLLCDVPCGVPAGMAYIILFSKWLLPGDDAADDLTSGLLVTSGSPVVGKTAKASGLSGGKVAITAISRRGSPAVPYAIDTIVQEGDVIFVTGGNAICRKRSKCVPAASGAAGKAELSARLGAVFPVTRAHVCDACVGSQLYFVKFMSAFADTVLST